ncbi:MAG: transcription termination factor NusA [Candidatus Dormibacteraceae bacterium]
MGDDHSGPFGGYSLIAMRQLSTKSSVSGQAEEVNLLAALSALSQDVDIPMGELLQSVESALAVAYCRAFDPSDEVVVRLDPQSGEMEIWARRQHEDQTVEEVPLPTQEFRRLAAQTARSAVLGRLRELERERALSEAQEYQGRLSNGLVDRIERGSVYVALGKMEGWMPPEEQIPGEELRVGSPITVVILEPNPAQRQAQVKVSRASQSFVLRILEAEVPEINSGLVRIESVAREAGLRTKVAVSASEPGIDPVGACVGPKGIRHRSLLAELGPEHVDIVPYERDPERFVAAALGPARVGRVEFDHEGRRATVWVPPDQLSLAIGRDGQNARLAARLTGWRVDIKAAD